MSVRPISSSFIYRSSRAYRSLLRSFAASGENRSSQLRRLKTGTMASNGVNGVNATRAKHDISALKVNQSRLLDAIHTGCKYGAAHKYGK